jgi:hypothetical protein
MSQTPAPEAPREPAPADGRKAKRGTLANVKIGVLLAFGIALLWVLACNLFAENWKLRLTPFSWLEFPGPATFYIFLFLAVGALFGFLACFLWLRGDRLREAMIYLLQNPQEVPAREASGKGTEASKEPPKEPSKEPVTDPAKTWKPLLESPGGAQGNSQG